MHTECLPDKAPTPSRRFLPDQSSSRPARFGVGSALAWLRDLAFSVLIAVVLIVFIYQPVKVEGTSMEPALTDQERIFINKFTYRFGLGGIERGDTVVFHYDENKSYIKRVIGLPGDRVRIDAGTGVRQRPPARRGLRPRAVPRHDFLAAGRQRTGRSGAAGHVFRFGRSPLAIERQPLLGLRAAQEHLRQSGVRLLAPGQNRTIALGSRRLLCDPNPQSANGHNGTWALAVRFGPPVYLHFR